MPPRACSLDLFLHIAYYRTGSLGLKMAKKRRVLTTASTGTASGTVSSSNTNNMQCEELVDHLLEKKTSTTTITKGGWCLRDGLLHVVKVDNGRLFHLVQTSGPPSFYTLLQTDKHCRHEATDNIKAPENCFQSLCRIIAGQQLAGKAAQAIWKRLLETTTTGKHSTLCPTSVLELAGKDGRHLEMAVQKPSGLSRAKAHSIFDLAKRFDSNELTETFLSCPQTPEDDIRQALLQVKGLGPWSCDMFIMFYLEKSNVFPIGDLGFRKGISKVFDIKNGKGKAGSLCQKKDLERVCTLVEPFSPYQSLLTYYMWRAADIKDVYEGADNINSTTDSGFPCASDQKAVAPEATAVSSVSTSTPRKRKSPRVVTP